jgi:hypothetical protein
MRNLSELIHAETWNVTARDAVYYSMQGDVRGEVGFAVWDTVEAAIETAVRDEVERAVKDSIREVSDEKKS